MENSAQNIRGYTRIFYNVELTRATRRVTSKLRDGRTDGRKNNANASDTRRKICKSGCNDVVAARTSWHRTPQGTRRPVLPPVANFRTGPNYHLEGGGSGGVAQLLHNATATTYGGSDGPSHSRVTAAHNDHHDVDTATADSAAAAAATAAAAAVMMN